MSHAPPRSSVGELPRGPAERWDRDKFESFRRRGPVENEQIHYEHRDSYGADGRHSHEFDFEDTKVRRGPRGTLVQEREHIHEDDRDRFAGPPPRARTNIFYEPTPAEIANQALAPYRRKSIVEREVIEPPRRAPARPGFLRRQSSLDTFDRRPAYRLGDEYRFPAGVPVPLPIRRPAPPRARSPSRMRYEQYEEISYGDADEEFHDIRIKRERGRKHKSKASSKAPSTRASSSSSSSATEVSPVRLPGKKGKTRMPRRLANTKAIGQLGYPYEEEDDFIVVQRALGKEQIDEIIELSKTFKETSVTTYKYDEHDTKSEAHAPSAAPPPPPPPPASSHHGAPSQHGAPLQHGAPSHYGAPPYPGEIVDKKTIIEYAPVAPPPPPPPPMSFRSPSPARSVKSHRPSKSRASSPARSTVSRREEFFEERFEESNHIGGPLTIVAPPRQHRNDQDVRREIASLEAERRALRLEREAEEKRYQAERIRESDYEVVEYRDQRQHEKERRDVVRVEKDRRVRSQSKRRKSKPDSKVVGLAMATLS